MDRHLKMYKFKLYMFFFKKWQERRFRAALKLARNELSYRTDDGTGFYPLAGIKAVSVRLLSRGGLWRWRVEKSAKLLSV